LFPWQCFFFSFPHKEKQHCETKERKWRGRQWSSSFFWFRRF
jgi:hypothetical protein